MWSISVDNDCNKYRQTSRLDAGATIQTRGNFKASVDRYCKSMALYNYHCNYNFFTTFGLVILLYARSYCCVFQLALTQKFISHYENVKLNYIVILINPKQLQRKNTQDNPRDLLHLI